MKKLPKVAVLLAIGSVAAAGTALPASAHPDPCPGRHQPLSVTPGTSGDDNGNGIICAGPKKDVDDHLHKKATKK